MAITFDSMTRDGSSVFLIGELERLDPILNEPLMSATWSRDVDVRTDVTLVDEATSYTVTSFGSTGGDSGGFIGHATNTGSSVQADVVKVTNALHNWMDTVEYTSLDLERSMQLGRPIDETKISGLQMKYNLVLDKMVYLGNTTLGTTGLFNSPAVTPVNVANGAAGTATWATKTPMEIVADIDEIQQAAWEASGYSVAPTELRLAPKQLTQLLKPLTIGGVGYSSILEYVAKNSLCFQQNGQLLNIQAVKWLADAGVGGTSRMVAYTKDKKYVQYPFAPIQRQQMTFNGLSVQVPYVANLGQIELRYAETVSYRDGLA